MTKGRASYFSAGSSRQTSVEVQLEGQLIGVELPQGWSQYSLVQCKVDTPIAKLPIVVWLPDGARLECENTPQMREHLFQKRGRRGLSVFHMETQLRWLLAVVAVFIATLFVLFYSVIPTASQYLARVVPQDWAVKIDDVSLTQLDRTWLRKSELPQTRREELLQLFRMSGLHDLRFEFRKGGVLKANAFALAGNTVILTDELIEYIGSNRQILGIVLHEKGHLDRRHVLSFLIRDATFAVLSMVLIGDLVGGTESLASLGLILVGRYYQRDHELEADRLAAESLVELGYPPTCFVEGLEGLNRYYKSSKRNRRNEALVYLSTHPDSEKRIQRIREKYPVAAPCEESPT